MAATASVPRVDENTDPQQWFAAVLDLKFREILGHLDAGLDAHPGKSVHDTRVSVRRLRSLIGDLGYIYDTTAFKNVVRPLKKLAGLLGRVRDQDVYIGALRSLAADAEMEAAASVIKKRISHAREVRESAFRKLTGGWSHLFSAKVVERFSSAVVLGQPELFRPETVAAAGREVIFARLTELTQLGNDIYDPLDQKGLHEIRIAAKHLRYATELFSGIFDGEVRQFAVETAELQSCLGDVHDCDIWIAELSKHLKKTKHTSHHTEQASLSRVLSALVRKRAERYAAALDLWNQWQRSGRFKEISELVTADG